MLVKPKFSLESLQEALNELAILAREEGHVINVAIYGGAALMLVSNFRQATRDVDAVADDESQRVIERLAGVIAERRNWPRDWLNDDVFPFLSDGVGSLEQHHTLFRSYPCEQEPGLRVYVPSPEYILAMKLMAMRIDVSADKKDREDIINLLAIVGLGTPQETLKFVADFYPEAKVAQKVVLGIEELFRSKSVPREIWHDGAPTYLNRSLAEDERGHG
jgi:hypothetical protein